MKSVVWLSQRGWIGVLVCVEEGVFVACVGHRPDCFISGALAVVRKMAAAMYALVNQTVIQSDPLKNKGITLRNSLIVSCVRCSEKCASFL